MQGPRLSRSNRRARRLPGHPPRGLPARVLRPWIVRGEDLDYMLDLRMYGSDIWFDNKWKLDAPAAGHP